MSWHIQILYLKYHTFVCSVLIIANCISNIGWNSILKNLSWLLCSQYFLSPHLQMESICTCSDFITFLLRFNISCTSPVPSQTLQTSHLVRIIETTSESPCWLSFGPQISYLPWEQPSITASLNFICAFYCRVHCRLVLQLPTVVGYSWAHN
jgi:hypothetical protein